MSNYPKISIWSQFRDAAGAQIELYMQQINRLDYPSDLLRFYLCEGDSLDDTLKQLQLCAMEDERITIIHHDTGIPHYAHSTRPERMRAVSGNGNVGWDAIANDGWGEFALMLESDLLYQPDLLKKLVTRRPPEADMLAPMIWIAVSGRLRFYDLWAFRQNGEMFHPAAPEYYYSKYQGRAFELDSVGSVVLFKMRLIHEGLRLGETDCIVGMCNEARKRGYRIFCDPSIDVLHPMVEGVS